MARNLPSRALLLVAAAASALAAAAAADGQADLAVRGPPDRCQPSLHTESSTLFQAKSSFAKLVQLSSEDHHRGEAPLPARRELHGDGAAGGAAAREPRPDASGHLLASCPRASETGCAALGGNSSVAVFIVGTLQRLLVNSTLKHLVRPIASQGFAVHLYISLVDRSNCTSWYQWRCSGLEDPSLSNASLGDVRALLAEKARAAGACPMCLSVSRGREELPEIPRNTWLDARMTMYPPWKSEVGKNVLRVWQARERLWSAALQAEKDLAMRYSLAMWTRDDQVWFSNVTSPAQLLAHAVSARTVWSRSCMAWGGINDKSVILGREAAQVMLTAYSSFFAPSPPLASSNAEIFLQMLANSSGLVSTQLPFMAIPSADAMLVDGQVCVLPEYKCYEAPDDVFKDCDSHWG